ncbi:hypothetical protein HanIR_Chr07g0338531 [Helianthus annuus]|nr:hypothetical protein HanIR_Chr07g0338531 [Helianthus annuus]
MPSNLTLLSDSYKILKKHMFKSVGIEPKQLVLRPGIIFLISSTINIALSDMQN